MMEINKLSKLFCASVLYPYEENESFDFEQYKNQLIPEYVKILDENCIRFEIHKGISSPGTSNVHFICTASFWIRSEEQFGAAMALPEMQHIMKKIAAFTNIHPIRQWSEVISP